MQRRLLAIGVLSVPAILVLLSALFLLRAPLLVVTDGYETLIYGEARQRQESQALAFRLFRPVKIIELQDLANPQDIAATVLAAVKKPWAAIFPWRYRNGEAEYRTLQGAAPSRTLGTQYAFAAPADLYRAGRLAAFLAALEPVPEAPALPNPDEDGSQPDQPPAPAPVPSDAAEAPTDGPEAGSAARRVGIITGSLLAPAIPAELERGFMDGGGGAELVLLSGGWQESWSPCQVVIVVDATGVTPQYLKSVYQGGRGRVILFGWMDPELLPSPVAVLFEDSIWTRARTELPFAEEGQPPVARSRIRVPPRAALGRGDRRALEWLIRKLEKTAEPR